MSAPLVSSVTLVWEPGHDVVRVWNRGALAGTLVLAKGDGASICEALARAYGLGVTCSADGEDGRWVHPS